MKYISCVLLLVFAILLAVCYADVTVTHNGQPGCKTDIELSVQKYRNNWDPSKYWVCMLRGQPATSAKCEPEMLFQDELKICVHHTKWQWTHPVEPPSRP